MDFSLISSPIRTFQSMVQCAINTSESIPREDLLLAFKASLNLLERIGELINHNVNMINLSAQNNILINNNNVSNIDQNSFLNSFTNHNNNNSEITFNHGSQSSPNNNNIINGRHHNKEPLLFSNRLSFPNSSESVIPVSCILPITSSQSFAALSHGLMKNGILSNDENLLHSRSISDDNISGPSSDNTSEINSPYLNLASHTTTATTTTTAAAVDKKIVAKQTLWHHRSRSPVISSSASFHNLKNESVLSPVNLIRNVRNHNNNNNNDDDDDEVAAAGDEDDIVVDNFSSISKSSRNERRKNLNSDELNRLLDSCEVKSGDGSLLGSGKKNYKCKFCGKMYDIKSSIRYHIRIIHLKMHLKTADMQCKLCGRVFTCATAANKHQMRCLKIGGGGGGGVTEGGEMVKMIENGGNCNEIKRETIDSAVF